LKPLLIYVVGLDQRQPSITEKKMVNIIKVLEHEESDRDDMKKETTHATVPLKALSSEIDPAEIRLIR